ncbi:MAG: caspase family protein [Gemmatimonadaceae bacterium]
MSPAEGGAVRRLLSIGIDQYPLWPADRQLNGCVNDVKLLQEILAEQYGFPREQMTLLTNAEATRDAILAAFDALVAATGKDDVVVVHYAGHGSQMTDLEGDEPSGRDSTMVPCDSAGWQGQNRDITDDEIALKLEALGGKTSFITLIFDCCHSGTITRDVGAPKARSLPPDTRSKEELLKFREPVPIPTQGEPGPSGWMAIADKYVLIAGCRDDESSYEYTTSEAEGRVPHGALTYFLGQELRKGTSGATYRDIFERAATQVTAHASAQHPQMEGKADREVLGVRDIEPMRFVRVLARTDDMVTLAGGAAHGMTAGSTFDVHAQGTKVAGADSLIGTIELTSVGAVTSEARVTNETSLSAIGVDARAVETSHVHADARLPVRLLGDDATALAALRAVLSPSPLLELTDSADAVTGRLLPARATVGADDPMREAGVLREPMWAFTSETGTFLMALKKTSETKVILENLEGTSKYRRALAFENTNLDSALRGKFDLTLMRMDAAGALTPATPDASAGGQVVFQQDEVVVFRITSNHDKPVFISLVDFGLSGAVALALPYREARSQRKLEPGIQFDYETKKSDLFYARWPKGFPFVPGQDPSLEGQAVESLKLFVTEQEADFSLLQQAGTRGGGNTSLGRLFSGVFQGHATRDLGRNEPADGDWTTVTRSFVIRRRSTQALPGTAAAVSLGAATLVASGLTGTASTHFGAKGHEVAASLVNSDLRDALNASGMTDGQTIEIAGARESGVASRSVGDQPAMELQLNAPADGFGQLVMATDELGVVSWHLAPSGTTRGATAAPAKRSYVIPQSVPSEAPAGSRGLMGAVGKKVLKELIFPLIDPVLGEVGASFVRAMETKRAPYRVRAFQPDDFASDAARQIEGDEWSRLGSGRALLFVHGTFSRSHLAFGQLPPEYMSELHQRYGGRVFAFDHFTLSHDPRENVKRFIERIPPGTKLDVDVVCHSRGGLVSRMLAERFSDFDLQGREVRVGRVVFVGVPNAGTPLANPQKLGDLIDVLTNVLDVMPGVTDVLTLVLAVVKQLAVGSLSGLDGLQSMYPGGDFLRQLNASGTRGDTKYFAITSDAKPSDPGLRRLLVTKGLNKLMSGPGDPAGPNDLVVPTMGVFRENGSAYFPIEERLLLEGSEGVSHTHYFQSDRARRKMLEWLTG